MTLRILVVCEAEADYRTATGLADRIIVDGVDWLDEYLLPCNRQWCGHDPQRSFIAWKDLKHLGVRIRPRSRFSNEPGAVDAKAADKALQYALKLADEEEGLAAVLLIRDADHQPDGRRRGLEQARVHEERPWPFAVIIGLADPKREAWVLAGYEPQNPEEHERVRALRAELKLDPCQSSERLREPRHGAQRNAKRVIEYLTDGDPEREAACRCKTSLDVLRRRGKQNGLAAYLDEVEQYLIPTFREP